MMLKKGDSGTNVRCLQQGLKILSYYSGGTDGSYGNGTVSAVNNFQRINELSVDGIA